MCLFSNSRVSSHQVWCEETRELLRVLWKLTGTIVRTVALTCWRTFFFLRRGQVG